LAAARAGDVYIAMVSSHKSKAVTILF